MIGRPGPGQVSRRTYFLMVVAMAAFVVHGSAWFPQHAPLSGPLAIAAFLALMASSGIDYLRRAEPRWRPWVLLWNIACLGSAAAAAWFVPVLADFFRLR